MAIATLVARPVPTLGATDVGTMSLALFVSCVLVGFAPAWLPTAAPTAELDRRLADCSGLAQAGKSTETLLKEQYPLALEVLGLPRNTPMKTMLSIVGDRLCHAKLAGMEPTDEACYVLGVQRGTMSLAQLKKRLMVLDTVMVLSTAGDSAYRYGCEEMAAPAIFLLLSPRKSG
ncbi:MAG: hypothetical protein IPK73_31030 [Candidatus Obscuribacter sp.]|nr:hypothetical protein [Candidatus Obscuribacter sp.]MBK9281501.1 hypothetical protein [Candidatus Obscuribacter sp.]